MEPRRNPVHGAEGDMCRDNTTSPHICPQDIDCSKPDLRTFCAAAMRPAGRVWWPIRPQATAAYSDLATHLRRLCRRAYGIPPLRHSTLLQPMSCRHHHPNCPKPGTCHLPAPCTRIRAYGFPATPYISPPPTILRPRYIPIYVPTAFHSNTANITPPGYGPKSFG